MHQHMIKSSNQMSAEEFFNFIDSKSEDSLFTKTELQHILHSSEDPLTNTLGSIFSPLSLSQKKQLAQQTIAILQANNMKRRIDKNIVYSDECEKNQEWLFRHSNSKDLKDISIIYNDLIKKVINGEFDTHLIQMERNRYVMRKNTWDYPTTQIAAQDLNTLKNAMVSYLQRKQKMCSSLILQRTVAWIESLDKELQKEAWDTLFFALDDGRTLRHIEAKNSNEYDSCFLYAPELDECFQDEFDILILEKLSLWGWMFKSAPIDNSDPKMQMILPYISLKENRPFASDALYHMYCDIAQYKLDKNNQLISTNSSMTLSEEDFITLMIKRKCFINQSHAKLILAIITGGYQSLVERASINKEPWNCTAWLLLNENLWDRLEEHFIQSDYWSLPPRNTTALKKSLIKRLSSSDRLPINCSQEALLSILPELFAGLNADQKDIFILQIIKIGYTKILNKIEFSSEIFFYDYNCMILTAIHNEQANCLSMLLEMNKQKHINHPDSHGNTPLMNAIIAGNNEAFNILMSIEQIDIHAKNEMKQNAVILAAKFNRPHLLKALIQKHAHINEVDQYCDSYAGSMPNKTAIMYAIENNATECLDILLNAGAGTGDSEEFRLQKYLDPNYSLDHFSDDDKKLNTEFRSLLYLAVELDYDECLGILLGAIDSIEKNNELLLALVKIACFLDSCNALKHLLIKYPIKFSNLDNHGCTPLILATKYKKIRILRILLDYISQNMTIEETQKYADAALLKALQYGYPDIAKEIIMADVTLPKLEDFDKLDLRSDIYHLLETSEREQKQIEQTIINQKFSLSDTPCTERRLQIIVKNLIKNNTAQQEQKCIFTTLLTHVKAQGYLNVTKEIDIALTRYTDVNRNASAILFSNAKNPQNSFDHKKVGNNI